MGENIISAQLYVFLYSLLLGGAAGLFYDVFRVLRRVISHSFIAIGIEDFAFLVSFAVVSLNFMISVLDGKIRSFIVIGEILGWLLYYLTISNYFMKLLLLALGLINSIFSNVLKPIIRVFLSPIILLVKSLYKFEAKIQNSLKKTLKIYKKRLKRHYNL